VLYAIFILSHLCFMRGRFLDACMNMYSCVCTVNVCVWFTVHVCVHASWCKLKCVNVECVSVYVCVSVCV
jgi:hypothetical protein